VLLTHNIRHFVALHRRYLEAGRGHAGILLTNETYIGHLMTRLLAFIPSVNPEGMKNQLRFL